ncbi:hypothetical protein ACJX0J_018275, partial [Zea mays]
LIDIDFVRKFENIDAIWGDLIQILVVFLMLYLSSSSRNLVQISRISEVDARTLKKILLGTKRKFAYIDQRRHPTHWHTDEWYMPTLLSKPSEPASSLLIRFIKDHMIVDGMINGAALVNEKLMLFRSNLRGRAQAEFYKDLSFLLRSSFWLVIELALKKLTMEIEKDKKQKLFDFIYLLLEESLGV